MAAVSSGMPIWGVYSYVCKNSQTELENVISTGTGWLTSWGYVATNYHVIEGHDSYYIIDKKGNKIKSDLIYFNKDNDIALLDPVEVKNLPPALPISSTPCQPGDDVFTIGYPHPNILGGEQKVTNGIIAAMSGLQDDPRMMQISVPVQSGNSGGPLINMDGEVVGIVTSKLDANKVYSETGDLTQNVNYALKVHYLTKSLYKLERREGVRTVKNLSHELSAIIKSLKDSIFMVLAE